MNTFEKNRISVYWAGCRFVCIQVDFVFDKVVNQIGTTSAKWDKTEMPFGVKPDNGLAMWTADSDYPTAPCVIDVASQAAKHGIFVCSWEYPKYLEAI